MTELAPFNEAQVRQLHILKVRGYQLTIVNRQRDRQRIGVAGRDPSGARIVGAISARGRLDAELVDYKPSQLMIGGPPAEPTVEEVIG